jgi:Flp pilus assembly protein TadG
MNRPRTASREAERGQILVIVAGGMIGLLAIVALVLEGGTVVLNRRDAQNASDLAALAGARTVALNYTDAPRTQAQVYTAMNDNLAVNDCGPSSSAPCAWEAQFVGAGLTNLGNVANTSSPLPAGALGVRVGVTRSPGAQLGRVIGIDKWDVSTEATAVSAKEPTVAGGTMLPIAMCGFGTLGNTECEQANGSNAIDFQSGQIYDLTDGKDAPGGFGWLSWTGSNAANVLNDSVCTPDNPPFTLDGLTDPAGDWLKGTVIGTNPADGETWFPAGNGKMNTSALRACLDKYISTGATVLIPIYDTLSSKPSGDNLAYHIVGLAAFVLTAREQPAVDQIQGYFLDYYPLSSVPGGVGWTPPDGSDITTFLGLVK